MASQESVRPLPPLTPPPPKVGGSLPPVRAERPELPTPSQDLELISTEGMRPGAFSPEVAIDAQIGDLERWALANLHRDRQQLIRFWLLKGLAFVGSVVAVVLAALGHEWVVVGFGVLSALCVAIDAAWPVSSFRNAHQRAVQDLRELENLLMLKWEKVKLAHPDPKATQRIAHALQLLDEIQAKREEIGKYLGSVEASPGVQRGS